MRRRYLWLGILAVQLAVPAFQLLGERPARFGWQMFAAVGDPAAFGLVREDGTVDTVQAADVLVRLRPEIDTSSLVPPHLCERNPDAVAVRAYPALRPEDARETPCP